MTDSQGGLPVPGTLVPEQSPVRIRRGEGMESWPGKISATGFTAYNSVVEVEDSAPIVVDGRAA